ncbi:DUF1538 domain-containing protein [Clostridium swellfunianum]|uniref:DUF1538 domain-containing protein n=1 Tax=Clostridium swellfunianum TaxID=1367462 RepID=UPI00202F7D80|nr:DUF1538 domain-containing protein [Clostridium swellfunianum]MCM0650217.1 DUF1538 domain-containing protein [Clostridium swellfunianum]
MNIFTQKLKEVLSSVLPITIIVLILNFTISPLATPLIIRFIIGTVMIIFGLSIFLIGVDIGVTPLGNLLGSSLTKSNKLWIISVAGIILGFFISIAEPGLLVLAKQVSLVTLGGISSMSILIVVSVGLAIMVALGFIRVVYNVPLYKVLTVLYFLVFILALFTSSEFLAIAFDASGATTGVLAVPFILALSMGISALKKDSKSSEKDSFGLVSIASVGAIMSVMILNLFSKNSSFSNSLRFDLSQSNSIIEPFISIIPSVATESFIAISPLLIIFLVCQKAAFKLEKRAFKRILKGFVYTFAGLLIFLVGVNAGFMDVGSIIGYNLASLDNKWYVIVIGFVIGLVTILAEPAVYVLTHQIEDVTSGYVKRKAVLIPLSIGVGFAVALSVIRIIVPEIQLWHYLLPGYIISIIMSFFVPKLFVGIAFDAGGVATGPMTATFILAFTQGIAEKIEWASVLRDGFGMISMVALTPIITLQILGLIFKIKSKKGGIEQDAR